MACSSRSMRNALRDLIGLAQDIAEAAIRRAKTFLGRDWKALWTTPLSEVRAQLNVDVDGIDAAVTQN